MKRILIIAAILVALLLGAILVLPNLIPSSVYKDRIGTAASEALGRDVTLEGEARLSVFPNISVRLGGMQVANPEGFSDENMIRAGALRANVKLIPLIFRRVEIGEITLADADIRLERLADGRANWTFIGPDADAEDDTEESGQGDSQAVEASLGRIRLSNANVYFTDRQAGTAYALTDFNAQARMPSLTSALDSSGSGAFNGQAFSYDVSLATPDSLSKGEVTELTLEFGTDFGRIDYDGELTLGDTPTVSGGFDLMLDNAQRLFPGNKDIGPLLTLAGKMTLRGKVSGPFEALSFTDLDLDQQSSLLETRYQGALSLGPEQTLTGRLESSSKDLRGLLGLLGIELAPGESLQTFDLKGDISGTASKPQLTGMQLKLDDTTARGDLGADLSGQVPAIRARLDMPALDVTPFLGASAEPADTQPSLNEDWSDDPLALEGLKAVNADIEIMAGSVTADQITLEDAHLDIDLNRGVLTAAFRRDDQAPGFRAFDGDWSGDLRVDASRATPRMSVKADASGVAAQKVLQAFTGYRGLSGIGSLSADLSSDGNSLKSLIGGLDGNLNTQLADGLIAGINMAQMVRSAENLQSALRSGGLSADTFRAAFEPGSETDFSSLLGNLDFTDGVAAIRELKLDNPAFQVTGSGQVDLTRRRIDISLTPKVDAAATGAGNTVGVRGIAVPLRISGPWTAPSFSPDLRAVQDALVSSATGRLEQELSNALGNAIGRPQPQPTETNPDTAPSGESETLTDDTAEEEPAQEEPQSLEDQLRDRALKELFGDN